MDHITSGKMSATAKPATLLSEKERSVLEILEEPKSAGEVAEALGWSEQLALYYIRKLMGKGCVEVSHRDIVRNTVATFYIRSADAFYEMVGKWRRGGKTRASRNYTIVVGSPSPHGPFMSSSRDMAAASMVSMKLGSEFGKGKVVYDIIFGPHLEHGTIYVVGGPRANRAYSRFRFPKFRERTFKIGRQTFKSPFHGLIMAVEDGKKEAICISGNTSHGTLAAAIAFSDDEIFWKIHRDGGYVAVMGFDKDGDGMVDGFEVLKEG